MTKYININTYCIKQLLYFFVIFFVVMSFMTSAHAAQSATSWEQGSFSIFGGYLKPVRSELIWIERSYTQYARAQRGEIVWGNSHQRAYSLRRCSLTRAWVNFRRNFYAGPGDFFPDSYTLIYPSSLTEYMNPIFEGLRMTSGKTNCSDFTSAQIDQLIRISRNYVRARSELTNTMTHRLSSGWSNSFSLELSPLPLEIEFFSGSLRVKYNKEVGRLKFSGKTGPKINGRNYNGLAYLFFVDADNKVRSFFVGGVTFSIEVEEAHIFVSGPYMVITCDRSCHDRLKQLEKKAL